MEASVARLRLGIGLHSPGFISAKVVGAWYRGALARPTTRRMFATTVGRRHTSVTPATRDSFLLRPDGPRNSVGQGAVQGNGRVATERWRFGGAYQDDWRRGCALGHARKTVEELIS